MSAHFILSHQQTTDSTMAVFFSKKQKQAMRERKRKVKVARNGAEGSAEVVEKPIVAKKQSTTLKKRPRKQQDEVLLPADPLPAVANPYHITVPKELSGEALRKFRKQARRQARSDGLDDSKLQFVASKTTKTKDFPRISTLLQQHQQDSQQNQQLEAQQQAEAALTENYKQQFVAVDCEMVGVGVAGKQSALARVSLVDWDGSVVLDTFVKVPGKVTDFRTWVSGVKAKHLKSDAAMEVNQCRQKVAHLLKNKILVGHALKNDLDALMLQHPKEQIRDTAHYQPYQRYHKKWRPRKLRDLAKEFLDRDIQVQGESHDSIDDAKAAMDLFRRARVHWEYQMAKKIKKSKKP